MRGRFNYFWVCLHVVQIPIQMSQDEVKKIKLKVKCRAIDESELSFDKQDKVRQVTIQN